MGILQRVLTWLGIRHDNERMPIEDAGETWYTVKEAAKLLGMSRQAVHYYIERYKLEVKPVGATFAISFATIAWIKRHNKR